MQQVAHAQGLLHVLVAVSVGNAALGGAELCAGLGQTCFFQTVLLHMVGHGDGCTVGDLQVCRADFNALLPQLVDLAVQMMRSMTMPLPITQTTFGRRMPEGSRFSTNLPRSFLTV